MGANAAGRGARDGAGWPRRDAERISGTLQARLPMAGASCAGRAIAAALALTPALALAEQPALSLGAEVTAEDAAWLFDAVCLVNHPDFQGSDAVLDDYGFPELETVIHRQHPEKRLQAIVLPSVPGAAAGARSCVVMAAGVGFPEVDARLAPLIAERLDQAERHRDAQIDLPHTVWVSRTDGLQTKIVLAEQSGGTVIAASVTPLNEYGLPEQGQ